MSRDIRLLHPKLQKIVGYVVRDCVKGGLPILITQTWRTREEQAALYAIGRSVPGSIVTNLLYPDSPHCWGVAFDFCRNVKGREYDDSDGFFAKVGKIGKSYGLAWGGDFRTFVDKPHLELAEFLPQNSVRTLIAQYQTPEKFRESWEESMRYDTMEQLPTWAQPTIKKLLERGLLKGDGNGNLNLSEDMIRILVIHDRAGVYQ